MPAGMLDRRILGRGRHRSTKQSYSGVRPQPGHAGLNPCRTSSSGHRYKLRAAGSCRSCSSGNQCPHCKTWSHRDCRRCRGACFLHKWTRQQPLRNAAVPQADAAAEATRPHCGLLRARRAAGVPHPCAGHRRSAMDPACLRCTVVAASLAGLCLSLSRCHMLVRPQVGKAHLSTWHGCGLRC